MASFESLFSSGAGKLILDVNTISYSIENNNSVIQCALRLEKLKDYSSMNYVGCEISMTINGQVLFTQDWFDVRDMKIGDIKTYATKQITINHAADGKKAISVKAYFKTGVQFGTASINETFNCVDIPRQATITAAPNITDEENATITYSNPAGNVVSSLQACISINDLVDDIAYRDIPKNGTSYTFELTNTERQLLRNATLSGEATRNIYFYVKTVINGITYRSKLKRTLTIVNATPTIAPVFYDSNPVTVDITGDKRKFISGYSNLEYEVNATTYKGATISSYAVKCGSAQATTATGRLSGISANKVSFRATDNRGLYSEKEFTVDLIPYSAITCETSAEIAMDGETTARVSIKAQGYITYSVNDTLYPMQIYIKHTESEDWVDLTPYLEVKTDREKGTYSFDFEVSNLDYSKAFTYQIKVVDVLTEYITAESTLKVIPVFDWSETDFNFNVPIGLNGETVLRHNKAANNLVLSASGGFIYMRPAGTSDTSGEVKITPQGNIELSGTIKVNGIDIIAALENAGII